MVLIPDDGCAERVVCVEARLMSELVVEAGILYSDI